MDALLQRLTARDQVFMTHEALALGYDDKSITRSVRSGVWVKLRHGAYTAAEIWTTLDERHRRILVMRAVCHSARSQVLVSHSSAIDVLGTPLWEPGNEVHVTRTDERAGRREAGVVQHRGKLTVEDVTIRDGMMLTSGTRTALDYSSTTDVEHAVVATSGLIRAGETSRELLERRSPNMDLWPRSRHLRLVIGLADGRFESVGEVRSFMLFWSQSLPAPIPQYEVRDHTGRVVAVLDFAWPQHRTFLEFDGRIKYERLLREGESASDAVVREKRREELVCGLTGWRCIRITWSDLYYPARTADRIRATFGGQIWAA